MCGFWSTIVYRCRVNYIQVCLCYTFFFLSVVYDWLPDHFVSFSAQRHLFYLLEK